MRRVECTFCASSFVPSVRAVDAEENNESEWAFNHRDFFFFPLRSSVRLFLLISSFFFSISSFSGMHRIHLKIMRREYQAFSLSFVRGSRCTFISACQKFRYNCQTIIISRRHRHHRSLIFVHSAHKSRSVALI